MNDSQTDSAKESTIGENIDMNDLRLLTILETCDVLRISRTFAYQLIREKRLRTVKIGVRRLVKPSAVRELISEFEEEQYG
jgi:excisionase family DNA binding protein